MSCQFLNVHSGKGLMKKIQDAIPARNDHIVALEELESTISPDSLMQWQIAVELWEQDSNVPNPFKAEWQSVCCPDMIYINSNGSSLEITEHAACLKISKEVEATEDPFATTTAVTEVHAPMMISMGMQLEEDQSVVSLLNYHFLLTLTLLDVNWLKTTGTLGFTQHQSSLPN